MESNEKHSPFKITEKKIRSCQHLSEALSDGSVVDFLSETVTQDHADVLYTAGTVQLSEGGEERPFFAFYGYEGLYVIPDLLPPWLQVEIAHFALDKAPNATNNTNLTSTSTSSEDRAEVEGAWLREKYLYDAMGPSVETFQPLPKAHVLGRLRWASLGFQYDWTHRRYPQALTQSQSQKVAVIQSSENDMTECDVVKTSLLPPVFPPRLATIIKDIVRAVTAAANKPSGAPITIEPEASIVNFFPAGTVMGGHVDDAELTYEHPVVSLSLGRSCVFLIGGLTKGHDEAPPLAMVLRSGYALLLHGDSRLRMHGVAKVFSCPCGDARRVQKVAGAVKKKLKWAHGHPPVCECMCSSFDKELEPMSSHAADSRDVTGQADNHRLLHCHDNLGGVECANHEHDHLVSEDCTKEEENREALQCASCGQPVLPPLEVQRVLKYMQTARININVRQVYPTGSRPTFI